MGNQGKHPPAMPKEKLVNLYRQALLEDVPLDVLDKKVETFLSRAMTSWEVEQASDKAERASKKKQLPPLVRVSVTILPLFLIVFGLFLVGNVAWPVMQYYLFTAPSIQASTLLAPIPRDQVIDVIPKVITQAEAQVSENGKTSFTQPTQPKIINSELDYTNLSNWFSAGVAFPDQQEVSEYRVDIPAVELENAVVKVGGTNLDKSLIQYPGTALPGQVGAPVIFGHSVLRQFYNPSVKNPRRYYSVFSKIMTLKPGDKIYITQDNIKYTYKVIRKDNVKPEDTFILEQRFDVKYLKLVTCTPEGTYIARGVVTAELVGSE
jgi:LPXTG-site transpeptidase (sortase) family protein